MRSCPGGPGERGANAHVRSAEAREVRCGARGGGARAGLDCPFWIYLKNQKARRLRAAAIVSASAARTW